MIGRLHVAFLLIAAMAIAAGVGCTSGWGSGAEPPTRVILITLDTTRADHLGAYGSKAGLTPHLDGLAAESVVFENAVSPVPTTLPSHSTIMTGLYPPDHGVRYNIFYKLAPRFETLAEQFRAAGFATAGLPASRVVAARFGLDQGFDHWIEPARSSSASGSDHPVSDHRSAEDGVDQAIEWLQGATEDRQFVWLHLYDPHWPYRPPFPYSSRYADNLYDGEIAYTDAQVGRLLQFLRADSAWSRTVVIAVADHGEGLFDHKEEFHSLLAYESTQRVPLIVRTPAGRAGRIAEAVTLADIAPTLLDLARITTTQKMRGISLRAALEKGEEPPRRDLYFEALTGGIVYGWAELEGVRYGDWKLIDSLSPELFNLAKDPGELDNQIGLQKAKEQEMRLFLAAIREGSDDDVAQGANFDDTLAMDNLDTLGYVAGSKGSQRPDAPNPRDLVYLQPEVLAAQGASARGDWRAVLQVTRYVIRQDPKNRWAAQTQATAELALGLLDDALVSARLFRDVSLETDDAYKLLANVHASRGEFEEALKVIEAGIERVPDSAALAYLSLVAAFDAGHDPKTICSDRLPAALILHPESFRLQIMVARCALRSNDNEAAIAALNKSVDFGLSRVSDLADIPEFAAIASTPAFQAIVDRTERPVAESPSE